MAFPDYLMPYRDRPEPLAYSMPNGDALCIGCMPHSTAQEIADTQEALGEIYQWTLNLEFGDPDLTCKRCGHLIATAPVMDADDD